MLHTLLITAALIGGPTTQADTVFAVAPGTRLEVENRRGEVVIRAWDRQEVRIRADLSSRQNLEILRSGSMLRVAPHTRGGSAEVDLDLDVPRWLDLSVQGNELDVTVTGSEAEIAIETVGGDIAVEGGAGLLTLRSIQGEVVVTGARGRVEATSVNEDVTLIDVDGEIQTETTNGELELRNIRADVVRAFAMNGDIEYDGTIRDGGRYVFTSHNGDLEVTVAEDANATVTVATYQGEFESEFPIRLTGTTGDKQFSFTLGSGSARVELQSFNGEIKLIRP
jgi:DUF4097 and DUF4098 domain-containing protein YvlB